MENALDLRQGYAIELPMQKIAEFCQKWQVIEFALFGSVLRDDFRPDSDIDVMVQFHPDAHPKFSTLDQMETELKTIFQRDVDLITRQGIKASRNYLRRREILSSAQVIYGTRSTINSEFPLVREAYDRKNNDILDRICDRSPLRSKSLQGDTERLEKLFEIYTQITREPKPTKKPGKWKTKS